MAQVTLLILCPRTDCIWQSRLKRLEDIQSNDKVEGEFVTLLYQALSHEEFGARGGTKPYILNLLKPTDNFTYHKV